MAGKGPLMEKLRAPDPAEPSLSAQPWLFCGFEIILAGLRLLRRVTTLLNCLHFGQFVTMMDRRMYKFLKITEKFIQILMQMGQILLTALLDALSTLAASRSSASECSSDLV